MRDIPKLPANLRTEKYGVVLERLNESQLEMVRLWRTSPQINQFMVYREPITSEMQRKWFEGLDPERDIHFVIYFEGRPCGLSDIKKIDWEGGTHVGGIFMPPEYWNTDVPLRVAFCALDFAFYDLGLRSSLSEVLKTNKRAVRFNRSLGCRILHGDDDASPTYSMVIERGDYERTTRRLRDYLTKTLRSDRK